MYLDDPALPIRDRTGYQVYDCKPIDEWHCGIDIGQANDSSAFAAINYKRIPGGNWDVNDKARTMRQTFTERFELRFLQRLPLRMPYPEQVGRVAQWLGRPPLDKAKFGLDYVSVGRPVADLFTRALRGRTVHRVLTTSGNEVTKHGASEWHVPKIVLVSQLESRLHTGEFRIAKDLAESEALKGELQDFNRKVSESGRVTYDARSGSHDDMVFSICVALFLATGGRSATVTRSALSDILG